MVSLLLVIKLKMFLDIKTCNNQKSFRYTASVAYTTTYAEATVSYSGGSLDVEAK